VLDNHWAYGSFGLNMAGNYEALDASLNYIYKQKYTIELGASAFYRDSPDEPWDHDPWFDFIIFYPEPGAAYDRVQSVKLLVGRLIPTSFNWIRFNLKGGITYSKVTTVENWERVSTGGGFFGPSHYYEFDLIEKRRFGAAFEPTVELAFSRWLGLAISPYLQINDVTSTYGCHLKLMIGLLRN
jgi:hypothetical protein